MRRGFYLRTSSTSWHAQALPPACVRLVERQVGRAAVSGYNVQEYWDAVGAAITKRPLPDPAVAGDDSPVQRYKRDKFLKMLLLSVPPGTSVLEVGSGPGENLSTLKGAGTAKRLAGADIAPSMIALARGRGHEVFFTDGQTLPFADGEFDVVFSATALQHNPVFAPLLGEMCRVTAAQVLLFADTAASGPTRDNGTPTFDAPRSTTPARRSATAFD